MEEWRPVVGYEGRYEVSSFGRMRSVPYMRILKPFLGGEGYYRIGLKTKGVSKNLTIHRIVASAFLSHDPLLDCVNHKDRDRLNNRLENLEWVTRMQNTQHMMMLGFKPREGEYHPRAKLTKHMVLQIRAEYQKNKEPVLTIAKRYGIAQQTMWSLLNNKTWKGLLPEAQIDDIEKINRNHHGEWFYGKNFEDPEKEDKLELLRTKQNEIIDKLNKIIEKLK